jgi:CDP-2,3-bis-(O-geranylgeranyl)-sn-glycerol synthase
MRHIAQDRNIPAANLRKVKLFLLGSTIAILIYSLIWTVFASIYDFLTAILLGFLWLVPSMITNALMPFVSNIKGIPRYPLDFGKIHRDGKRILGEHKSWNGLIGGTILGFTISAILTSLYFPIIDNIVKVNLADGETVMAFLDLNDRIFVFVNLWANRTLFYMAIFVLCLATPIGDAVKSYYKRRKGIESGDVFLFWDQNDFILASIFLTFPFFPLQHWITLWFYYIPVILITPFITVLANIIGYYLGKKKVPY